MEDTQKDIVSYYTNKMIKELVHCGNITIFVALTNEIKDFFNIDIPEKKDGLVSVVAIDLGVGGKIKNNALELYTEDDKKFNIHIDDIYSIISNDKSVLYSRTFFQNNKKQNKEYSVYSLMS